MVYVQPSLLGWRPLVESWAHALPSSYTDRIKESIFDLCDWLLPPTLRLVTKFLRQPVKLQDQV
jgi:dynein heavy chain